MGPDCGVGCLIAQAVGNLDVALHRSTTAATMVRKYMGKGQNVGLRRQIIAIRVRAACFAKAK
jgi:hypothetical protein